jgi:OFA family oxalate/formate antiporter-like MFS transporter
MFRNQTLKKEVDIMKNRWFILFAGIMIQTILGGIYAWSIFVPELVDTYGLTRGQCGSIFGISILVFTIAMIPGGRILTKYGPRITALSGAILFLLGYLTASLSNGNFLILIFGISILSGAGIGFGYVCPLTVGMQWFPDKKGLITGVAVAGFGGGAVLLSNIAQRALEADITVLSIFHYIAWIAGAVLILCSLVLDIPEKDSKDTSNQPELTPGLWNPQFGLSVLGIFSGTFSGLLVVGNLKPLAMSFELSSATAAIAVSIFAAGNATGRVLWGFLFDKIHYRAIPYSLCCAAFALLLLSFSQNPYLFMFSTALLGFSFGGNFVIYASALTKYFGVEVFPKIYPFCFLGYGIAGVTGPATGGALADSTGSYMWSLGISFSLCTIAACILFSLLHHFENKNRKEEVMEDSESSQCN